MDGPADIPCHQIVELVTEYLEGGLDDEGRTRFEMHIMVCRGCENYLNQMRLAAEVAGSDAAMAEEPSEEQLEELRQAFRSWRRRTLEER